MVKLLESRQIVVMMGISSTSLGIGPLKLFPM
jgi:hypothetical protein